MRKLTVAAAVAVVAASLASFVTMPWHPAAPGGPTGSISPHEITLATPEIMGGVAADAF
jgi:PDZ domain-containing secreted protein